MTKQAIIQKTIVAINNLPEKQANEISDFAESLMHKYEEDKITGDIQKIISESKALDFLKDEDDIYSLDDIKLKYND